MVYIILNHTEDSPSTVIDVFKTRLLAEEHAQRLRDGYRPVRYNSEEDSSGDALNEILNFDTCLEIVPKYVRNTKG